MSQFTIGLAEALLEIGEEGAQVYSASLAARIERIQEVFPEYLAYTKPGEESPDGLMRSLMVAAASPMGVASAKALKESL